MQAAERQAQFLKEFQDLLNKHGAEFEIMDTGGAYHAQLGVANISMSCVYDNSGITDEYTDFNLPNWMAPEQK